MSHNWIPYEVPMASNWEQVQCEDPTCNQPKNSMNMHIRCRECKDYPPLETAETNQIWFMFERSGDYTVHGPCMNPFHDLMKEVLAADGHGGEDQS